MWNAWYHVRIAQFLLPSLYLSISFCYYSRINGKETDTHTYVVCCCFFTQKEKRKKRYNNFNWTKVFVEWTHLRSLYFCSSTSSSFRSFFFVLSVYMYVVRHLDDSLLSCLIWFHPTFIHPSLLFSILLFLMPLLVVEVVLLLLLLLLLRMLFCCLFIYSLTVERNYACTTFSVLAISIFGYLFLLHVCTVHQSTYYNFLISCHFTFVHSIFFFFFFFFRFANDACFSIFLFRSTFPSETDFVRFKYVFACDEKEKIYCYGFVKLHNMDWKILSIWTDRNWCLGAFACNVWAITFCIVAVFLLRNFLLLPFELLLLLSLFIYFWIRRQMGLGAMSNYS